MVETETTQASCFGATVRVTANALRSPGGADQSQRRLHPFRHITPARDVARAALRCRCRVFAPLRRGAPAAPLCVLRDRPGWGHAPVDRSGRARRPAPLARPYRPLAKISCGVWGIDFPASQIRGAVTTYLPTTYFSHRGPHFGRVPSTSARAGFSGFSQLTFIPNLSISPTYFRERPVSDDYDGIPKR